MTEATRDPAGAFRALSRALWRRRLRRLDVRLRVELLAIALMIAAFVLWQLRNPLDHARRVHGPWRVALMSLVILAALAVIGGGLAGVRHLRTLRRGPAGPPWLVLPLPPHVLARHLSGESRAHALWISPIAAGALGATGGLIPVGWMVALAAAFVWLILECSRVGCAIALRVASLSAPERSGATRIERALIASRPAVRTSRVRAARWRAGPPALALWRKDLLLSIRRTGARRRLATALGFFALSLASWLIARASIYPPGSVYALADFAAFALSLATAGAVGEWLIALSGEDPFGLLRVLPVDTRHLWLSRAAWALIVAAIVMAAHALLVRPLGMSTAGLSPEALQLFLVWVGGATLLIAVLGVNYGITLFPRADLAQRLYAIALGFTIAASLMITLMGWLVLIAAVVHSSLKLRHWSRHEEAV